MLKLDTVEKRAGFIVVLACLLIMVVLALVWSFTSSQLIGYHMPDGQVVYYKRGARETALSQLIQFTLIIFPALFCGLALMFGYGKRLINWVKNGSGNDEDRDERGK